MRRLYLSPTAVSDLERLLAFRESVAPLTTRRLHQALRQKIMQLPDLCALGFRVGDDIRELYMKHGRARYVFRYQMTLSEVILLRVWSGREDRN